MTYSKRPFTSRITSGFSLIELLVAVSLLAVFIGIMSYSFLNLSPKYKLKRAVWEIHSRMNFARYKAIFDGTKIRITFNDYSYFLEKYDESQNKWQPGQKYFLDGVTVQANNTPTFYPGGTVSNLASIYVFNSWGKYKITLAISGRIKITEI